MGKYVKNILLRQHDKKKLNLVSVGLCYDMLVKIMTTYVYAHKHYF